MRGLYVPGAPVLGNISAGGGGADLSDIDLTSMHTTQLMELFSSLHLTYGRLSTEMEWQLEGMNLSLRLLTSALQGHCLLIMLAEK